MTGIKLKNVDKELKLLENILQDKNLEIDWEKSSFYQATNQSSTVIS